MPLRYTIVSIIYDYTNDSIDSMCVHCSDFQKLSLEIDYNRDKLNNLGNNR